MVTSRTNLFVNNLLLALDKMLQTDNIIELSESKGMMINSLRILGGDDELIETVINKLENAIVEKCKEKSGFSEIYNRVQQEMKYFQVLESALNELLYLPYKLRYETEIIERANSNAGKVDDCYCVPAKVSGMIKRKNGKYCMSEQLTLGGLAFFCLGMDYNPDKKDLVKFVRDFYYVATPKNTRKISDERVKQFYENSEAFDMGKTTQKLIEEANENGYQGDKASAKVCQKIK